MRAVFLIIGAAVASTAAAGGRADACVLPTRVIQQFWPCAGHPAPTGSPDPRCQMVGGAQACHWSGSLYRPASSSTGTPAIVLLHGGGRQQDQQDDCEAITYFTSRGYVVFTPNARGTSDSTGGATAQLTSATQPGFTSTGTYFDDHANNTPDNAGETFLLGLAGVSNPTHADHVTLRESIYFGDEAGDVNLAVGWLQDHAGVGPVAVIGHSYGGIVALELAANPTPALAAVDISGAVAIWDRVWDAVLPGIAGNHVIPIRMLQASNETAKKITPTKLVFLGSTPGTGTSGGDPTSELFAYGAVAGCSTASCAHTQFFEDPAQVARWGSGVYEFIRRSGVK